MINDMYNWGSVSGSRSTIVVVEDSPTQALNLQSILGPLGVNVIVAVDGIQGLKVVQQVLPDAVVLDVELPGMNGFDVCKRLKESKDTSNIPVIMLTRHDEEEAVLSGLQSGVIEYIPKDAFGTAVLLETLRQMGLVPPANTDQG
ncbi:MAG: response regulator [Chloroflexota bacterium]|nr:MAG: response regulator [Chloroflexota bacterium]